MYLTSILDEVFFRILLFHFVRILSSPSLHHDTILRGRYFGTVSACAPSLLFARLEFRFFSLYILFRQYFY